MHRASYPVGLSSSWSIQKEHGQTEFGIISGQARGTYVDILFIM